MEGLEVISYFFDIDGLENHCLTIAFLMMFS
ncbi:hypothetical protein P872_02140 [Rhodonellum psychrophilum GCM71 = DSM 17998]|uniref:Uncharacterized protein n=1 Tax=Rhodonellum psychrophilum GCM71 = DSM 17998 TaxID=1123057 RepID=U5BTD0_9BACT|nr:hypothetical protein P872_02140 [Rhodonellum psychrophilum GCM71 = DSM 17998]